jgi:hypothetical protein
VTGWLDEVQASMDAVVGYFLPVDTVFLFEIRVKTRFNVLNNGFPARTEYIRVRGGKTGETDSMYLSSLLTKSPKPGVSTTVRRRRTPFSSMSEKNSRGQGGVTTIDKDGDYLPALMLWMATV